MQTSNQAIRNLGRHARHVATIGFTSLGLAVVTSGPASAQTHHSGERSDDFTMMPRNMTPLPSNDRCSTGQIAVGSTGVDVSSGATTGVRSWVSYFLGQTRPTMDESLGNPYVGTTKINADGTVTISALGNDTQTVAVPYASLAAVTYVPWRCGPAMLGAEPVFTATEKLMGSPPSDWRAYRLTFESSECN